MTIRLEPFGERSLPNTHMTYTRVGKEFALGKYRLEVNADVHNLFNVNTATSVSFVVGSHFRSAQRDIAERGRLRDPVAENLEGGRDVRVLESVTVDQPRITRNTRIALTRDVRRRPRSGRSERELDRVNTRHTNLGLVITRSVSHSARLRRAAGRGSVTIDAQMSSQAVDPCCIVEVAADVEPCRVLIRVIRAIRG